MSATDKTKAMFSALTPTLANAFFEPETKRIALMVQTLIKDNHAAGGHLYGFYHEGEIYSNHSPRDRRGQRILPVQAQLFDQAVFLKSTRTQVARDKTKLTQALVALICKCSGAQMIRDVLPEYLVRLVPSLQGLPRFNDEEWFYREQPSMLRHRESLEEITLYYAANRLIYP